MKSFENNFRPLASVNLNALGAVSCGFIAWAIWPTSVEGWGFGMISIFLGVAAIAAVAKVARILMVERRRKQVMADYLAQGARQKSARLVSDRELREKGLLDG